MGKRRKRKSGQCAPKKNEPTCSKKQDQEKTDSWEWVPRLVSHVVGGSVLVLPHAMSQARVIPFIFLLMLELHFIFESFEFFHEMMEKYKTSSDEKNTNYFDIVKKCCKGKCEYAYCFTRLVFVIDVAICTAFYFKAIGELLDSFFFIKPLSEPSRSGFFAALYIAIACILILFDYGSRDEQVQTNNEAADEGTHAHTPGYYFLLFTVMCVTYVIGVICLSLWQDPYVTIAQNATQLCSGIKQPIFLPSSIDLHILRVTPAIIFGLMNYVIILPICTKALGSPQDEYASLIWKSQNILALVYTGLPFLAVYALGDSVPVLFPTAFGHTIHGQLLTFVSVVITFTAVRLRVMACCNVIQNLIFGSNNNSNDRSWIIVIFLFFISFAIASAIPGAIYLGMFAGSFNCNLLLIIIPRVVYIKFKIQNRHAGYADWCPILKVWCPILKVWCRILKAWCPILKVWCRILKVWYPILKALGVILFHIYVFVETLRVYFWNLDLHVGMHCRDFFNQYWGTEQYYACLGILIGIAKLMFDLSRSVVMR